MLVVDRSADIKGSPCPNETDGTESDIVMIVDDERLPSGPGFDAATFFFFCLLARTFSFGADIGKIVGHAGR